MLDFRPINPSTQPQKQLTGSRPRAGFAKHADHHGMDHKDVGANFERAYVSLNSSMEKPLCRRYRAIENRRSALPSIVEDLEIGHPREDRSRSRSSISDSSFKRFMFPALDGFFHSLFT